MLKRELDKNIETRISFTIVIPTILKQKTKTMDRNKMTKNAEKIMEVMKAGYRYSLAKLQEITAFGTTELCMAVLVLIREKRIEQYQCDGVICYSLCKA